MKTLKEIIENETSQSFHQSMDNAMAMSYFKYGHINQNVGAKAIDYIAKELKAFEEDHNTEHMINVANYAMIRYAFPQGNESYNPTDSNASTHNTMKSVSEWIRDDITGNL